MTILYHFTHQKMTNGRKRGFIKISYSLSSFAVWKGKKIQKQKQNNRKRNKPTNKNEQSKNNYWCML